MKRIPLSQGQFAIVDDIDFGFLSQWKWYAGKIRDGAYRALRKEQIPGTSGYKTIYMHREILRAPDGVIVDHRDCNALHNWRSNLRACTSRENGYNKKHTFRPHFTSRFKGVGKHKGKWRSRIYVDGKNIHLGQFATEVEAARAYDSAAKEYFGEFAHLNFPEEQVNFPVEGDQLWMRTNTKKVSNEFFPKMTGNQAEEAII